MQNCLLTTVVSFGVLDRTVAALPDTGLSRSDWLLHKGHIVFYTKTLQLSAWCCALDLAVCSAAYGPSYEDLIYLGITSNYLAIELNCQFNLYNQRWQSPATVCSSTYCWPERAVILVGSYKDYRFMSRGFVLSLWSVGCCCLPKI